ACSISGRRADCTARAQTAATAAERTPRAHRARLTMPCEPMAVASTLGMCSRQAATDSRARSHPDCGASRTICHALPAGEALAEKRDHQLRCALEDEGRAV